MDIVDQAFKAINRADFVPGHLKNEADLDIPLPIGYGQTISQPTTVRLMMEWLEPRPGDKVLDIGSGSGWTSALLASMVGLKGEIFAVERIPELTILGRENCRKAGIKRVRFFNATKGYGLTKHSPYDRILVSAAAEKFPKDLLKQLKVGGKLVIPVQNDILEITKTSNTSYETIPHYGFMFVPLI